MLNPFIDYANKNAGFINIILFVATIMLGVGSGIFKSLQRKPDFKMNTIDGPTFCATYGTGKKFNEYDVHQTGISLYLRVSNLGSAPASIVNIALGFKWNIKTFSKIWFSQIFKWDWIKNPITSLSDFRYEIGEDVKVYPFLLQGTATIMQSPQTYLNTGESVNGVIYYELNESFGGCFPKNKNNFTKVKVKVFDSFGRKYTKVFTIPIVDILDAKKYCSSFGDTYRALSSSNASNLTK